MEDRHYEILEQRGYRIVNTLGKGAFGCVYHLRELDTGRSFACKVSAEEKGELLLRESEILRKNRCFLFPTFYGVWQEEKYVFLLMELIIGESGEHCLERLGAFQAEHVLEIGKQLEVGLRYLHRRGYVYRDLKPQNILICEDGRVRLVDMGCVCKIGVKDAKVGTYGFAPKEQLDGEKAQTRFDFFALAMVLQCFWTGTLDFTYGSKNRRNKKKTTNKDRILLRCINKCIETKGKHWNVVYGSIGRGYIHNQFFVEKDIVVDD